MNELARIGDVRFVSVFFCFSVPKLCTKLKKQDSTANYSTALTTYH